jgi:putative ABC transport system substrate-binding protein
MDRRAFIAGVGGSVLAAPLAARAQTPRNIPRVAVIYLSGHHQVVVDGLRLGLREQGVEEGKQVVLDIRELQGDQYLKAVEEAARDFERAKVALIYTVTTHVTTAAKRATAQIPIVFYVGADPVAGGLVESLAKPGGRLTGVHGLSQDLMAKRLEILKEMIPRLGRVVTFYNPADALSQERVRRCREAARQLGVEIVEQHVTSFDQLRLGLQRLQPREVHAYFHTPEAMVTSQALLIIDAARGKKLPTMFHEESSVVRGALVSYGHSFREIGRLSAKHVQRILAGTHPKDLPVENYDKVGLALNLRTAREIGLTISQSFVARADKVID